jgi:hypothetical protein
LPIATACVQKAERKPNRTSNKHGQEQNAALPQERNNAIDDTLFFAVAACRLPGSIGSVLAAKNRPILFWTSWLLQQQK